MTKIGLRQFGRIGFLAVILAGTAAGASWTYTDNFSSEKAKEDSCIQSLFWLDRATPPPGSYLYYLYEGWNRKLVFMGYQNQLAELGYCFPVNSARTQRTVKGWLTVNVSFPENASISQTPERGQLLYSVSGDGVAWSETQGLSAGLNQFPIESPSGTAYVRFFGTRAAIDDLDVSLSSPAATVSVSAGESISAIQAAIDAAASGDVIEVGPGTYSGSGNIEFRGKALTLRSTGGPDSTIINVAAGQRGFYFRGGEDADSVLSGFTIRNGQAYGSRGGGIYCEYSSPTITNCIIQNCNADVGGGIGGWNAAPVITDCTISGCSATYGGGLGFVQQSDPAITRCEIEGNTASYGGGLYCSESLALVGGCRISGNAASVNGGGVYCTGTSADVTFKNCVVASNSANVGGGIYTESAWSYRGSATVNHCTIANNQVPYLQPGGGLYSTGTNIFVTNTIVWDNGGSNPLAIYNAQRDFPVTFSCVQGGGYSGEGNFNEFPLFVNASAGDYHLQSRYGRYNASWVGWTTDGNTSPCIDAGDLVASSADEPTPNGGRVNMGAYGATREASKSAKYSVWHVNTNGGRDAYDRGLSQSQAFKTISYALEQAGHGDTILVWPGVYREELVFGGKAVTLQSAADAAVLQAENDYAVSFYSAESPKSILSNFVIRNCSMGAVFCQGASPTLRNLTIVNNGYGIVAYEGSEPYIVNCILWSNGSANLFGCEAYFSYVHGEPDSGARNISGDPLFVDPYNLDPDQRDFHLKSANGRYVSAEDRWVADTVSSPCIDAGNWQDYYEAELEPNGDVINMGAYGGTPYASKSSY